MKRVCVFCGSQMGKDPYAGQTFQLARALVRRGLGVVYGGGGIGLMRILADTVRIECGEVIGVIPRGLAERELAHPCLTELHVVASMHERKALMANLADGFLGLPGGYGTLDELFEILTWSQLGLLTVAGFFDPLLAWIDRAVAEDFIKPACRGLLLDEREIEPLLDRFVPLLHAEAPISDVPPAG